MERLQYLVRRFHQISPDPLVGWRPDCLRELHCWLRDDVGPDLQSYVLRPRFREQASWPIQTLSPVAKTPQRALVDTVDRSLTHYAQALQKLVKVKDQSFGERLEKAALRKNIHEEVVINGASSKVLHRKEHAYSRLPLVLEQIAQVAGRFWHDLVCAEDYFEPAGSWGSANQSGEFIVSLNPELHPGGDFVSRCLWRRIEVLRDILEDFHALCCMSSKVGARRGRAWKLAEQRRQELADASRQLREACLGGTNQPLRDACILLTQVHAALALHAELEWLGLPEFIIRQGAAIMSHRLFQTCQRELFERLAASLHVLRGLYADVDESQSTLEEAIASGALVIVRSAQAVYWEGQRIEVSWTKHQALWRFLLALAEKGRMNAAIDWSDLHAEPVGDSTVANTFSRLKKVMPVTLWKRIHPSMPRAYRLDLDSQRIILM